MCPTQDCVCVERLVSAGAVVVGKTNNPEFCYRGTTSNAIYGTTRNPRDPTRTAGGSSGGAAASVAAGMVPLAVGTDGGGSIRIPSAFCGVYGIKPTFGLVPKLPGFRGWPTLSVTGPIAASVRDLALALSVMAGPSPLDPLSYPSPATDYVAAVRDPGWHGLRVAASEDMGFAAVDPDVRAAFRAAVEAIRASGVPVDDAHPDVVDPGPLWDAIALPEGYASEGPLLETAPRAGRRRRREHHPGRRARVRTRLPRRAGGQGTVHRDLGRVLHVVRRAADPDHAGDRVQCRPVGAGDP